MLTFDHIALSGETLEAARDHAESRLGVPMQAGGQHAVFNTHNVLLGLSDGLYFEAIAIDPAAPRPKRPRWFDLDSFAGRPRLTNWICRCDDLEAALRAMPEGAGVPVDLRRGDLRWRMAVPANGRLPFDNCFPALIEWQSEQTPPQRLAPSGVTLLDMTVSHPQASALEATLAPHLDDARITFRAGSPGITASFDVNGTRCVL